MPRVPQFRQIRTTNFGPSIAALSNATRSMNAGMDRVRAVMDDFAAGQDERLTNEAITKGLGMGLKDRDSVQKYVNTLPSHIAQNVGNALYKDVSGDQKEAAHLATQDRLKFAYEQSRLDAENKATDRSRKEAAQTLIAQGLSRGLTSREDVSQFIRNSNVDPQVAMAVAEGLNKDVAGDLKERSDLLGLDAKKLNMEATELGMDRNRQLMAQSAYTHNRQRREDAADDRAETAFGNAFQNSAANKTDIVAEGKAITAGMPGKEAARVMRQVYKFNKEAGSLSEADKIELNLGLKQDLFLAEGQKAQAEAQIKGMENQLRQYDDIFPEAMRKEMEKSTNVEGLITEYLGPQIEDPLYAGVVNAIFAPKGVMTGTKAKNYAGEKYRRMVKSGDLTPAESAMLVIRAIQMNPEAHDARIGTGINKVALDRDISLLGKKLIAKKQGESQVNNLRQAAKSNYTQDVSSAYRKNISLLKSKTR